MRTIRRLTIALVALTILSACNGGPAGPSPTPSLPIAGPSPAPPMPPPHQPPKVTGTVALVSIAPQSGATVTVRDCSPRGMLGQPRPAHFLNICTEDLRMIVDVSVDQDLPNAILTVEFWDGAATCGVATIPATALTAGHRASFNSSTVNLYSRQLPDQPEHLVCPPPATTTGIIVRLRVADHPHTDLLRQDYERIYTFAMP